jgi:aminopeptidase N
MVRQELGEEGFWRSLRLYAERHARGSVDTRDLAQAIEDATARNLEPFFDRWIRQPGHPELDVTWSWDDERKVGRLAVNQTQTIDEHHPPFTFTTKVRFEVGGAERDESVSVRAAGQIFEIALPSRPTQVVFDPGDVLLKTVKMEKGSALWRRQLEAARLGVDRVLAARALGRDTSPQATATLAKALGHDPFWGVRAAAAKALGQIGTAAAVEGLLGARQAQHPKVRRAVASALGQLRDRPGVAEALADWLGRSDSSLFVEGEVARALGKARHPRAVELLTPLLASRSFQQTLKTRAMEGLGASGDERALPVLLGAANPADPFPARRTLIQAVTELVDGTPHLRTAREFLERMLRDRDFRVRAEAAASLARLRQTASRPALESALASELDGRGKRRLEEALEDLRSGLIPDQQLAPLRAELERLLRENIGLRERLDVLEAKADRSPRKESPGGGRGPSGGKMKRPRARPVVRHKPPAGRPLRRR